jgi:hypothetical protein
MLERGWGAPARPSDMSSMKMKLEYWKVVV